MEAIKFCCSSALYCSVGDFSDDLMSPALKVHLKVHLHFKCKCFAWFRGKSLWTFS